jgi:lipoate-protein ligase A
MALQIVNTGASSAEANMAFDGKLLDELDPRGNPILHLYRWEAPSATYGYFIDPEKHFDLEQVSKRGLTLARRPTGGGIIFHIWDLAFSFLMPSGHPAFSQNTLENYRFVNNAVLEAMKECFSLKDSVRLIAEDSVSLSVGCRNFCMAKPTQYDVVYEGMKIAGAAQRKRKQGYLHQGSISLAFPDLSLLREVLLSEQEVLQAMETYSFAPLGQNCEFLEVAQARDEVERRLIFNLNKFL